MGAKRYQTSRCAHRFPANVSRTNVSSSVLAPTRSAWPPSSLPTGSRAACGRGSEVSDDVEPTRTWLSPWVNRSDTEAILARVVAYMMEDRSES